MVYSSFRDNTWGVDLADIQSLSKYNKGIKYLLCATGFLSKYAWVVLLKDKRGITIINEKGGEGGEFYNKLFKRFLRINNIEMYSTYNKGKSVVVERFIRTLKNKIF